MDSIWPLFTNACVGGAVVLLGYAGYHAKRGKPYPPRRDPKRLAGAALGLGALAAVSYFVRAPASPIVVAGPPFTIEAPPGWTMQTTAAMTRVVQGALEDPDPPAILTLDVSRTNDTVDTARLADFTKTQLLKRGLSVPDEPIADTVAGLPAHLIVSRMGTGPKELCSWIVKRGPHQAASVQCGASGGASCKTACQAPLARLRWLSAE